MTINAQGNLYVSDAGFIHTLSPNGNTIATWDETQNIGVTADIGTSVSFITLDPQGNLYVPDHHLIDKFSPTGKLVQVWKEYPTDPVSLDPIGMTTDAKGTVYAADRQNHRVLRVGNNGKLQSVWDTSKEPKQTFVESVADGQGNLYVVDGPNPRQIEKISPQGSVLATWKANCPDDAQ